MDRRPNAAWVSSPVVWPGWIAARFRSGAQAPRRPRSGRDGGRGYPTPIPSGSGTPPGFQPQVVEGSLGRPGPPPGSWPIPSGRASALEPYTRRMAQLGGGTRPQSRHPGTMCGGRNPRRPRESRTWGERRNDDSGRRGLPGAGRRGRRNHLGTAAARLGGPPPGDRRIGSPGRLRRRRCGSRRLHCVAGPVLRAVPRPHARGRPAALADGVISRPGLWGGIGRGGAGSSASDRAGQAGEARRRRHSRRRRPLSSGPERSPPSRWCCPGSAAAPCCC